jgi:hypothetical protein
MYLSKIKRRWYVMKLTNGKVEKLLQSSKNVLELVEKGGIKDTRLKFRLLKNIKMLESEFEILEKVHPKLIKEEYDTLRFNKLDEICDRDEEGNPILIKDEENKTTSYSLSDEETVKFNEWTAETEKELSIKATKIQKEFMEILTEEIELPLRSFNIKVLNELDLKSTDINILMDLIEEDEDEKENSIVGVVR